MQTAKPFVVGLFVLCCTYRSDGLLDTDNTLLTAIKHLNSSLQQTAAELQNAKTAILTMNATIQKSANDLQNDKTTISEMNTTIQKSDMTISFLKQEVHQLRQGTTPPVIFYAYLSLETKFGPDQAIRFDNVLTNVGNAYDTRHGHFTAPMNGYYHFSATILSVPDDYLRVSMVKNGAEIAWLYADNVGYQTGSGSVDIELAANDMVWLMLEDSSLHSMLGGGFSFFSGYIINKKV